MSIDDRDVLTRLRAGAEMVEEHRFDADQVLTGSRRALRRRRSWQAVGACTAAVAFSLTLAGTVPVPGVGDVTLPGSVQMRELLGITESEASGCVVPEPAVRRSVDVDTASDPLAGTVFDVADARPISDCYDVRIDGRFPHAGADPSTITGDGAFWRTTRPSAEDGYLVSYQVFGTDSSAGLLIGDKNSQVTGLTAHGRLAAWYELEGPAPDERTNAPRTIRVSGTALGEVRTIGEAPLLDTSGLVMTDERVAWRHGSTVSEAPLDGSAPPEPLARRATAVGSDNDEIVVAALGQDTGGVPTTTFTSYRDDGSVTTLLTVKSPGAPVTTVDITDDVLTYASEDDSGDLITAAPRTDGIADRDTGRTVVVRLGTDGVDNLSAVGDTVAWVSGTAAYLLRDTAPSRADGPDLVQVGRSRPEERIIVGLAGDRIAWGTSNGSVTVGTLQEPGGLGTAGTPAPAESGASGRAVPAAPSVTVPEDAQFPTHD